VNPALSEGLPPFLAHGAGLNSGFMMPQVTAAALVSENKVLAHPASVDSITTSGNKEDYVSMGMTAANKLKRIVDNTRNVLAIEAMAVAQAIDFLAPLKTSKRGQAAHAAIRSVCPTVDKDRVMYKDLGGWRTCSPRTLTALPEITISGIFAVLLLTRRFCVIPFAFLRNKWAPTS
jgi:histidine ammonia-lyase